MQMRACFSSASRAHCSGTTFESSSGSADVAAIEPSSAGGWSRKGIDSDLAIMTGADARVTPFGAIGAYATSEGRTASIFAKARARRGDA